jgi:hypothetical protein
MQEIKEFCRFGKYQLILFGAQLVFIGYKPGQKNMARELSSTRHKNLQIKFAKN